MISTIVSDQLGNPECTAESSASLGGCVDYQIFSWQNSTDNVKSIAEKVVGQLKKDGSLVASCVFVGPTETVVDKREWCLRKNLSSQSVKLLSVLE